MSAKAMLRGTPEAAEATVAGYPYRTWVEGSAAALRTGEEIGTPYAPSPRPPPPGAAGPKALVFSPQPDDEVIIGGLPLRLLRERGHGL